MNWKNISTSHKIATVIAGIAAMLAVINMVKPTLFPVDMTTPAISVFTICEALLCWNQNRKLSYLMIAASIFSLICFILELLIL